MPRGSEIHMVVEGIQEDKWYSCHSPTLCSLTYFWTHFLVFLSRKKQAAETPPLLSLRRI